MNAPDLVSNTYNDADALLDDLLAADAGHAGGVGWANLLTIREPHEQQARFIHSTAKRKIIRAGRRGGKTTGIAILALLAFKAGLRVLYAAPTSEQVGAFWYEVKLACQAAIDAKLLYKNEAEHIIEVPGTKNRIRAKTAWNADTLRGDYGDLLIFDEYQLMNEDAWGTVGAPMLLDNDGDAVFIYTPRSLHDKAITKATDPRHASKLFKKAAADTSGRWETFHFRSHDNPHISPAALETIAEDMTALAYRQEIGAEDIDEALGALWKRSMFEQDGFRLNKIPDHVELVRVVGGVDPPGGRVECGIVYAALGSDGRGYVLSDDSTEGSPDIWGNTVVTGYHRLKADRVVGEKNYGGDMVEHVIRTAKDAEAISYKNVTASRGKAVRAEPVSAQYERGRVSHVGIFAHLEEEMVTWEPDSKMPSPNRMDALVWALTELMLDDQAILEAHDTPDMLSNWRG